MAEHKGKAGDFDSGWSNFDAGKWVDELHESGKDLPKDVQDDFQDWYYSLNSVQWRVVGSSDGGGNATYTVQMFKLYNFGNKEEHKNDFVAAGGAVRVKQEGLAHLHAVGLAQDFNVVGSAGFAVYGPNYPCCGRLQP